MGTNYYVKSSCGHRGQHIGKRSGAGGGEMVFIWAVEPRLLGNDDIEVESESGDEFTREQFEALLDSCHTHDHSSIGEEFS